MNITQVESSKPVILDTKEFREGSFFTIPGKDYLYQVIKWESVGHSSVPKLHVLVYASGDVKPTLIVLDTGIAVYRATIKKIEYSI